jgi:hypothetical protein
MEGSRKSGRTTRLIDKAIQDLFNNGNVKIADHHDTLKMHRYLFDRVVFRLHNEHFGIFKDLIIELRSLTIKFK